MSSPQTHDKSKTSIPETSVNESEVVWESSPLELSDETTATIASTLFNLIVILGLAMIPMRTEVDPQAVVIVSEPPEYEEKPIEMIEEITYSDIPQTEVGANSIADTSMAEASAEIFNDTAEIPNPAEVEVAELGTVAVNNFFEQAVAPLNKLKTQRGSIGVGVNGAAGAVDRITFEILKMMEDRPTLVVWLFDRSGSLHRQRQIIRDQFDRVYDELGIVMDSKNNGKKTPKPDIDSAPLLTSVIAYGQSLQPMTVEPTADLEEIKAAVELLNDPNNQDVSGIENVFQTVVAAVKEYQGYTRKVGPAGRKRNVMFVVVTDERGDDVRFMEEAIKQCKRTLIPVHVIGVPAPFGRPETLIRYVDPDPSFDQTPHWAQVDQGPESLMPEHVQLGFSGKFEQEPAIDSGFGPYGLTRLAIETGGQYFANHPNRRVDRKVNRYEIEAYAADLEYFFDPSVMHRYQPQYLSYEDYVKQVKASPLRSALVDAAMMPSTRGIDSPQTRFKVVDQAALNGELRTAQEAAAILMPKLYPLKMRLMSGLEARETETVPRWKAGFDLALGRVLAHSVRTDGYNDTLAMMKSGQAFKDPKNNVWQLQPAAEVTISSRLKRDAELATSLLQAVVDEHPGTPWAYLAEKELEVPMGWKWTEEYEAPPPPRTNNPGNNNNNPMPQDDQKRMLQKKQSRPIPKL
jgi:hypothetical protein